MPIAAAELLLFFFSLCVWTNIKRAASDISSHENIKTKWTALRTATREQSSGRGDPSQRCTCAAVLKHAPMVRHTPTHAYLIVWFGWLVEVSLSFCCWSTDCTVLQNCVFWFFNGVPKKPNKNQKIWSPLATDLSHSVHPFAIQHNTAKQIILFVPRKK